MSQSPRSQKTERPTPRRLEKARERGQVPRSREVAGAAGLLAFLVFAHFVGPGWLVRLRDFTASTLQHSGRLELETAGMLSVLNSALTATGMLLLVPLGMMTAAGLGGNLIQGAPTFTLKPLAPKFSKLNPIKGLQKIVSLKQWVEVLKGVLKMGLFGVVCWFAATGVILSQPVGRIAAGGTFQLLVSLAGTVLIHATALASGLALLDVLFRRYDHVRDLRMTKREIKDEHKENEGDPMVKAQIRQKQSALARSRMMADVALATVVVTNPQHVAVALQYLPGESAAPKVLAKGRELLAARIRTIAEQHRIPIIREPPLARALYSAVAVGAEIPPALFRAVAEILALVMSRKVHHLKTTLDAESSR